MGITGISRPWRRFAPFTEDGVTLAPGIGFPIQLSATEAGVFVNLRRTGETGWDIEAGSDLVIIRDPYDPASDRRLPLTRGGPAQDPRTGERLIMVHSPIHGGFVPLGAVHADGTPHRAAGTGFGLYLVIPSPGDGSNGDQAFTDAHPWRWVLHQYRYDGRDFVVTAEETMGFEELLEGYYFWNGPMSSAIPDGDDLLFPIVGNRLDCWSESGVSRWRYIEDAWRPIAYHSVTGGDASSEPSLIRDADGALLFTARGAINSVKTARDFGSPRYHELALWLWRSHDGGVTWELLIDRQEGRARSPISLNRAADGTPYFALNPFRPASGPDGGRGLRDPLVLLPISEDRRDTTMGVTVRNGAVDFGPAPGGHCWLVDHPIATTLRLGDGVHHLLAYRVLDHEESHGVLTPTPFTGCYLVEVESDREPVMDFHLRDA